MKTLILATRRSRALDPLTERTCAALLPVAGKSVLEHTLDAVATAGLREVAIAISPHAEAVEARVGDGSRWGLSVDYVLARGDESPDEIARALAPRLGEEFLVLRGDLLRGEFLKEFLEKAATLSAPDVAAYFDGVPAGARLVREYDGRALGLPTDPEDPAAWKETGAKIDFAGRRLSLLENLPAYHRANLDAVADLYAGLIVPARKAAQGVYVGRNSKVASSNLQGEPVFVGERTAVGPGSELHSGVVLSGDIFVDRGATLRSTVVLPHTYVGELVELENAIAWGDILIRVDTGSVTRVPDYFLLSDMGRLPLEGLASTAWNRTAGWVLFLASLPLWPLAAILGVLGTTRPRIERRTLLGNRRMDEGGISKRRRTFDSFEWNVGPPLFRYLPRILAVLKGDMDLVGVPPLSPEEAKAAKDDWEKLREGVPCGLVGPTQLTVDAAAPAEERRMMDAFYATTRSTGGDLLWILRGLGALFTSKAWKSAPRTESGTRTSETARTPERETIETH